MKVRDRIGVITDLLLGAVYADGRAPYVEREAVRKLLCDLLLTEELPPEVEARLATFDPAFFDLAAVADDFAANPPMNRRRLLELVGQMCMADGVFDLSEVAYVRELAAALGMKKEEYSDLVRECEVQELRRHLRTVRMTPAGGVRRPVITPPDTPPSGVSR